MFNQNTEIGISQFILTQTGTYQEQTIRPFTVEVNADAMAQLERSTRGGQNISVASVQNVASELVRPQGDVEGVINIAQGWRSRRFRFMMKVIEKHPFNLGAVTQRIFFGYTDQCDVSLGQRLDPNMRIYFNAETIVSEIIRQTTNGPVRQAVISGANQIVSPIDYNGSNVNSGYYARPTAHLIRPEDVFSHGQATQVVNNLNRTGQFPGGVDMIINTTSMVGQGGAYKYSHRRDTSPARYLTDTLGAYQQAVRESTMNHEPTFDGGGIGKDVLYGDAQTFAANQDIHSNSFLAILKDGAGYMERGYVTFADLCKLFPEAARIGETTLYAMDDGRSIRQVNFAESAYHWSGADPVSIAASLLAQVIPAIMMDNFLRHVSFAITNGMGPNNYMFEIHEKNTRSIIDGINMMPYLQEFQRRLITDVINTISRGNQIPFQISMASDLVGDSVIDIVLGNEAQRRYVAPTFTDSLFSPMLTRDATLPGRISNDLLYMVEQIVPGPTTNQYAGNMAAQPSFAPQPAAPATISQQGTTNDFDGFGLL